MGETKFVRSAKLAESPKALLREVTASGETCYITQGGRAKAVLMDINRYNALMDLVEESESLKSAAAGAPTHKDATVKQILKGSSPRTAAVRPPPK